MQEGIFIAASGAMRAQKKLDVIGNNLANVNDVGFKKDSLVFESLLPPFKQDLTFDTSRNVLLSTEQSGLNVSYVSVSGFSTDFDPGSLELTGNTLDVAIDGDGFFAVKTPDGVRYTRKGNFHIDEQKQLVSQNGYPVLNDAGALITIQNITGEVTIDPKGFISGQIGQTNAPLGRMKLVTFDDKTKLQKQGDALYQLKDPNISEKQAFEANLRQGFLEQSNVKPVEEIGNMVTAQRSFEAYSKVIQTIDEVNERAVNTLGRIG